MDEFDNTLDILFDMWHGVWFWWIDIFPQGWPRLAGFFLVGFPWIILTLPIVYIVLMVALFYFIYLMCFKL